MSEYLEDLFIDSSESFEDGNYFLVTITELELGKPYPIEFQWKYKDGTIGKDWSAVYNLQTPGPSTPVAPDLNSADVAAGAGFIKVTWGGFAAGTVATDFDRVNIYIAGTSFGDGTKPAGFFKKAETRVFNAEPGIYTVVLKIQTVNGAESSASIARTVTVAPIEEQVENPVTPTGFSSERILGGIEVAWNGTYTGGASWYGFQAINIYAGTSATATAGTYIKVGQMTANKTTNKIVVPQDGTYVRYNQPVYIHASSINKANPPVESAIVANVTNQSLGARSAIATDLADQIITNAKLVDDAVTAAKIATSAITETKIASDAVTSPKIVANAITADKIVSSAITADKIATNAVTAGKILAGTIDVTKLAAGTISANNMEAGIITSTTFIRAGTSTGNRIEISSSTVGSVLPGLYIYNGGSAVFSAPISGGLSITGSLSATSISTNSGRFNVSSTGILTATDADITGGIKAVTGYIGSTNGATGWHITASGIQNSSGTVQLNGTTGTITGATITGGTVQTSTGSNAVILNGSNNSLQIKANGTIVSHIVNFSTTGTIWHHGSTPDTNGFSYPHAKITAGRVDIAASTNAYFSAGGTGNLVSGSTTYSGGTHTFTDSFVANSTATFNSTMFAPNLTTSTSATNLRVATGSVGEIQETSASSIRYKENVQDLILSNEVSPNNLLSLPVRSFTYKSGYVSDSDDRYNKILPGFIAEEVEEHYPIAVDYSEGQPHTWNERFIIPGMLALIQNLNQELISVKSRLDALEG
jgi:hypothetical protein